MFICGHKIKSFGVKVCSMWKTNSCTVTLPDMVFKKCEHGYASFWTDGSCSEITTLKSLDLNMRDLVMWKFHGMFDLNLTEDSWADIVNISKGHFLFFLADFPEMFWRTLLPLLPWFIHGLLLLPLFSSQRTWFTGSGYPLPRPSMEKWFA